MLQVKLNTPQEVMDKIDLYGEKMRQELDDYIVSRTAELKAELWLSGGARSAWLYLMTANLDRIEREREG